MCLYNNEIEAMLLCLCYYSKAGTVRAGTCKQQNNYKCSLLICYFIMLRSRTEHSHCILDEIFTLKIVLFCFKATSAKWVYCIPIFDIGCISATFSALVRKLLLYQNKIFARLYILLLRVKMFIVRLYTISTNRCH